MTDTLREGPVRGYRLMSAEHALASVSLRRLKITRFSEANDPFELAALNCMKRPRRQALGNFREEQNISTGMLCFSKGWKNPVLWSHYAVGHRGVCLGFDIAPTLTLQHVEYEAEKLNLKDDQDLSKIPEDVRQKLLVTKFKHWDYEEEMRAFVPLKPEMREGTLFFYPFGNQLVLKEVILGHHCPKELLAPLRTLVRSTNPEATVSKARLGFKFFEVKESELYPAK